MLRQPLPLSQLAQLDMVAVTRLRGELRERGFACVQVDDVRLASALDAAILDAVGLNGFRFPPTGVPVEYTPLRREAFKSLFRVATCCLEALMATEAIPEPLQLGLASAKEASFRLFGLEALSHEPFEEGQAFGQSFFNLFNYDCGLLNPHFDRSLLTVIRVQEGGNVGAQQSALWVEGPDGCWRNADATVREDEVVILIGEDSEDISCVQALGLKAAQHTVRVDPAGEYVSQSHFRPDPDTPHGNNRRSAAFILRYET